MGNIKSQNLTTQIQLLMHRRSPRMDSNLTLASNLHDSSRKGEHCCLKRDQFAIATCNDNHPESDHCFASPATPRPHLRIDSWRVVHLKDEKEQGFVSFRQQEHDLFHDSLVISGAKLRPLNPLATVGSVILLSLVLLALILVTLLHTSVLLPARKTVMMLYVPPAAAASSVASLPAPTSTFRNIQPTMISPSAVHS